MNLNTLINELSIMQSRAAAWEYMSEYLNEAHEYVQKYCMPGGWGANVWVSILKDAQQLRRKLDESKINDATTKDH